MGLLVNSLPIGVFAEGVDESNIEITESEGIVNNEESQANQEINEGEENQENQNEETTTGTGEASGATNTETPNEGSTEGTGGTAGPTGESTGGTTEEAIAGEVTDGATGEAITESDTNAEQSAPNENASEMSYNSNNDYEYFVENNEVTIFRYIGTDKDVVIPSTIDGYSVVEIAENAFLNSGIRSVVIPEGVKLIGDQAFMGNELTSVDIPGSVTRIGDWAFFDNDLTSVTIGSSVEYIGLRAFSQNNIDFINLPSSVKVIGDHAFSVNNLTSIDIPDSVTDIGKYAFADNHIEVAKLPVGLTTISEGLFSHNNLTSIDIPESVVTIEAHAFRANNLVNVRIPDNVTFIGEYAFSSNLLTSVIIGEKVETIGERAFGYNNLTEVVIPDSVRSIGQYVFADNKLTKVTLSNAITEIPTGAFMNNDFTEFVIPDGIVLIGESAFVGNELTSVTFGQSLKQIKDFAFYGNNLTSVNLPEGVNSIGSYAFGSNKLTSITVNGSWEKTSNGLIGVYFDYWAVEGNQTNPSDLKVYGYAGTMVEEVANYRGYTFIDITPVPEPDQRLKINEVFPDENLAKYFAEWMSALPSWQGKSDSTFSMAELDARIKLNGALNFNASNRGIRSLKGMEIFGDVATKYSDIPVNFDFSGNLLEDVDPYKITSVRTLFLNDNKLKDIKGLRNLKYVTRETAHGAASLYSDAALNLQNNLLTDISPLSNLKRVESKIDLSNNKLQNVDGLNAEFIGFLDVSNNYLTSLNTSVFDPDKVYAIKVDHNFIQNITSVIPSKYVQRLYGENDYRPQYSFNFIQSSSVKVEYRVRGTNELISYDIVNDVGNFETRKYKAKNLAGYILDDDLEKEFSGIGKAFTSVIKPVLGIKSRDGFTSIQNSSRKFSFVTHDSYSNLPNSPYKTDGAVLSYDSASGDLVVVRESNNPFYVYTDVDVYEGDIYLGTYSVPVLGHGSPDAAVVFYYKPVAKWTLTVNMEGRGYVSPYVGTYNYDNGSKVNLYASPNFGYRFDKWVVNGTEFFSPSITITMDSNKTAVAHFVPLEQYKLSVNIVGEGEVNVLNEFTMSRQTYGSGDEGTYEGGTSLSLTPAPKLGYRFVKWVVDGVEVNGDYLPLYMDSNKTVEAHFESVPLVKPLIGHIIVKFLDMLTMEKIKEDEEIKNVPVGEYTYTAEEKIGDYKIVGEAVKTVIITMTDFFKEIIFLYEKEASQPEPTPQPQPEPKPEPQPEPKPEPQPEPKPEPQPEPKPEPQPEPKPEPQPEPKPEPQPEPKPEPQPEPKPEPQPEPKPEPQPEPKSEPTPTPQPEPKPVPQPELKIDPKPVVKIQKRDKVTVIAVDNKTGKVLMQKELTNLSYGYNEVRAPKIEGYEVTGPSLALVRVTDSGKEIVVKFRYEVKKAYGTVFGVVIDSEGNPIEGVMVELHSKPRVTYTNEKGEYRFENVELGKHTVILKNPYTLEEIAKIEVIAYKDVNDVNSGIKEVVQVSNEVRKSIELNETVNTQRIDFVIEPIKPKEEPKDGPKDKPQNEPKEKPKDEPKDKSQDKPKGKPSKDLPIIPIVSAIPFIILLGYLRRKNVKVYNEDGMVVAKLRVKARPETVIDLSGMKAETLKVVFRNPERFRKLELMVKYNDMKVRVELEEGKNYLVFKPTEE
ncbi:leucine-rich repeat protein [Geobacillus kaustophilus]|uniref:leucine-rich repeat protein n=1 Tax=Geobacillus kaustophilus TaxID=1462 RepID=UPI00142E3F1C|nr:leucine-rich repeat protein [Geobacillus kaustophilus]